jgi:SAM-dependent methyltransferase
VPTVEAIRTQVHTMWASVATRWGENAEYVDERGAALTDAMLGRVGLAPGSRVLELACGAGGAGLAAAAVVGPTGEVVVSDVVPEMAAIAGGRASARGLSNVRTATLDLEHIEQPDAAYDVVLCREGLMFAVQPEQAATEIARVLRPDGRVAVAVWGARHANPWLGLVFDAVGAILGRPVPPPGVPGPFALGDPGKLRDVLAAGGLVDIDVTEIDTPCVAPSFEAWWARTASIAGPLATVVSGLDPSTTSALVTRLREAMAPFATADGLVIPGRTLLASARRP